MEYFIAILCVFGLSIGQILFKLGAAGLAQSGSFLNVKTATPIIIAMLLYLVTSLAWIWVLRKIDLGRIYPLMALAFVIVPIGSHFVFGERFQAQYFLGLTLIIVGIVIVVRT